MNNKEKFIYYEILASTLWAGFMVRGGKKIYNPNKDKKYLDKKKDEMHQDIKQCLVDIGSDYFDNNINDADHIKNIFKLKNQIQERYKNILFDKTFRFGVAQKLLNLYLKYLWALGWINSIPPHCPIDGKISEELKSKYKFAISDDEKKYEEIIKTIKQVAGIKGQNIAEWEMNTFMEVNYPPLDFSKVD